ncbi:MAG: RHS repeat protein, partial [Burkholderiaceae bacterium]|nr:RHS repeat protein [Burkholderiaceae bacterium]
MHNNKPSRWLTLTFCALLLLLAPVPVLAQACHAPAQSNQPALTATESCNGANGAEASTACTPQCTGGGAPGMMHASVQTLRVSLALSDQPLAYTPAKGPAVPLGFYYSQREAYQPQNFHYANLGPKWTYGGLSYVIDDPQRPGVNVQRYKAGGGTRLVSNYNRATGGFARDSSDHSQLVRVAGPSLHYERHLPDGSIETYAHSDGKNEYPRRFFLSERRDPAGNRIVIVYDPQNRITRIRDASGQNTTLEYKHRDPLKITAIVDPHGRRATLAYDRFGRLITITDAAGMSSSVTYSGNGTFIDTLSTPYGVSRFASGSGQDYWVEITGPLGRTERVEARDNAPGIADAEPTAPRVSGLINRGLSQNNTYYWDAANYSKDKRDYGKATVLHWDTKNGATIETLLSSKAPLESRQWYVHAGN